MNITVLLPLAKYQTMVFTSAAHVVKAILVSVVKAAPGVTMANPKLRENIVNHASAQAILIQINQGLVIPLRENACSV